jgi:glucose/arabinose dehydrogenase
MMSSNGPSPREVQGAIHRVRQRPSKRAIRPLLALAILILLATAPVRAQTDERPPFAITVVDKTAEHPFHGLGSADAYAVDGVAGRHLTFERGVTYVFEMEDVASIHPFYISTSRVGLGQGVYQEGVTGNFATTGQTLRFTPGDETPSLLYYQCSAHDYMGGFIHVVGSETVELVPIADGLTAPVDLTQPDDGTGRLFVVDQTGLIRIIGLDGALLPDPFLDLRSRMTTIRQTFDERGLLGLAFHPEYASNGRFFVHYSGPLRDEAVQTFDHTTVISEFVVSSTDPERADHDSERVILRVDQPQFNHNGGAVAFGPDGYLYVSLGDGGGGGDTGPGHVEDWYEANEGGNAQAVDQNLLGGILRIDVDGAEPYAVPDDNPFVGHPGLDEIYAFGLRNPYRISFDLSGTGELFVADAGQDLWEGIYLVEAGGNYGWNVREGTYCFDTANRRVVPAACPHEDPDGRPLTAPVIEYPHIRQPDGLGVVVVGGHVYRGSDIPQLSGRYIFGDWSSSFGSPGGRVFAVTDRHEDSRWGFNELRFSNMPDGRLGRYVLGFGRDLAGEVYLLTSQMGSPTGSTGAVHRLGADTGVSTEPPIEMPSVLTLEQNFPNPFGLTTSIRYHIAQPGHVNVAVYDVLGRKVATLVDGHVTPGSHTVLWDATDSAGRSVPNGAYLYRLSHSSQSAASLMVVLR